MAIMDFLFGWLLDLEPALGIFLITLFISLMITLAVKFLSKQSLMKELKEELKELQKEMKDLKNNPKKMAKINARFMETNMKYMSHSMRPTLYTFIPILLVFGWLSSHFAYYPLEPGKAFLVTAEFNDDAIGRVKIVPPIEFDIIQDNQEQDVDKVVAWRLISYTPGNFTINVLYKEREYPIDVIITTGKEYATVEKDFRKSFLFFSTSDENGLDRLKLGNEKILPFSTVPVIKDIPWVGGWGWFGVYIFFSLIFSMGLRKIFNVY